MLGVAGPERAVCFMDWSLRVPEPKSGRLDFERFPFQRELYTDGADVASITVMKSTQVGASAWLLRWALYWPDACGLTAMYLFPAGRQMADFSNSRIAPLLRGEYLASRVASSEINNVHQRQIGNGWLFLRGAQAEAGLSPWTQTRSRSTNTILSRRRASRSQSADCRRHSLGGCSVGSAGHRSMATGSPGCTRSPTGGAGSSSAPSVERTSSWPFSAAAGKERALVFRVRRRGTSTFRLQRCAVASAISTSAATSSPPVSGSPSSPIGLTADTTSTI